MGAELICMDGMDGQTDMMKLIGPFCEYVDSPKNAHSFGGCKSWSQFRAVSDDFTKVGPLLSPFRPKT